MHIIIDRALYSLHDTCKLIVTASLHRKDNPGCSRVESTPTHGFSLFIYLHQANATIQDTYLPSLSCLLSSLYNSYMLPFLKFIGLTCNIMKSIEMLNPRHNYIAVVPFLLVKPASSNALTLASYR